MVRKDESAQEKFLGSSRRRKTVVVAMITVCAQLLLSCGTRMKARVADEFDELSKAVVEQPPVSSMVPASRPDPLWKEKFASNVNASKKSQASLVFLGDSITDGMVVASDAMERCWSKDNPLVLGVPGDCTQNLLWRIQHGEVDSLKPKLFVVLIGTNNMRTNSDREIFQGIAAVVHELRTRLPKAKVLVLGLLPCEVGILPAPSKRVALINELLRNGIADGRDVFYIDAGQFFLSPDDSISRKTMPDYLHPSKVGYKLLFSAIKPTVDRLLSN